MKKDLKIAATALKKAGLPQIQHIAIKFPVFGFNHDIGRIAVLPEERGSTLEVTDNLQQTVLIMDKNQFKTVQK